MNTWVVTAVVHAWIYLVRKIEEKNHELDEKNTEMEASNQELLRSNEELAAREEEISRQNEELQSLAEELEQQSEELRQQSEEAEQQSAELHELNLELIRKDRGFQTLLDTGRWLRGDMNEHFVMNGICQAGAQIFGVQAAALAVAEDEALLLKGDFGFSLQGQYRTHISFEQSFSALVVESGRTASLEDIAERPDLQLPPPSAGPPFRAVLAAIVWLEGKPLGTLEVYSIHPRQWTEHDFRIIEWLAAQAAIALQAVNGQKELELKRRLAEESSVQKSRFLAAVSHDVRTPANAISLLAEMIERASASPDRYSQLPDLAKNLWNNARALVDLVSGVLDIARFDAGKLEVEHSEFLLSRLLQAELRQAQALADRKGLSLRLDLPEHDIYLVSDRSKLARVLANLINNAIKFTDAGSVVVSCEAAVDGTTIIEISDTGIGIPNEHLESVFDEFFQLRNPERNREKGSGLGLAICNRLIRGLGFQLRVRSLLGVGTTFTIEIPSDKLVVNDKGETEALPPGTRKEITNPLAGRTVLLVEDHDVARCMTAELLVGEGAQVCSAANGREAVKLLAENKHEVLLLDLNLPDIDGADILRSIQSKRPQSLKWIVVVSADVRPERLAEIQRLGAHSMIPKPICIEMIRKELMTLGSN